MLPFFIRSLVASLLAAALSGAIPQRALAHGSGPQQIIDGYTLTLVVPEQGWYTGDNPLEVILWDALGHPVPAEVRVTPLAYRAAEAGHGAEHSADAAAHDDSAAEDTAHNDGHAAEDAAHSDDHSDDGAGLVAAAVRLLPGDEPDVYHGAISFDRPGTWSVGVVFVTEGREHGAIFELNVVQSRPRGLVLGGFVLLNLAVITTAAVLKRRSTRRPRRAPASINPQEQAT